MNARSHSRVVMGIPPLSATRFGQQVLVSLSDKTLVRDMMYLRDCFSIGLSLECALSVCPNIKPCRRMGENRVEGERKGEGAK